MNRLRLGEPIRFDRITVVAVERISVEPTIGPHGGWISATKEPVAVLVRDDSGIHVFGTDGREMPASELRGLVDGITEWVSGQSIPTGGQGS